jgi:hypothetical protein
MANKKLPLPPYKNSLDRLWDALPLECPMRVAGREQYDAVWSDPDPLAMVTTDPTLNILHSPIIAEVIGGYANEFQIEVLGQHFTWMIRHGSTEEFKKFNDDIVKCRKKIAEAADNGVAVLIELTQGLEHALLGDDGITRATSRERLIEMATDYYPELFPDKSANLQWNDWFQRIKPHIQVKASKLGAPLSSDRKSDPAEASLDLEPVDKKLRRYIVAKTDEKDPHLLRMDTD